MTGRTTMEDRAWCRAIIAQHSRSFSLASWLLPPPLREEVAIIYAWCRRADDAVDLANPCDQKEAVERLQRELESLYEGNEPSDPVLRAFQGTVFRYRIPRAYPQELLLGLEMDASGTEYRRIEDLLLYCYRVASTVGLMLCHVMGVRDAAACANAAHLGVAMQLTNICRDVREDWERGRNYLPMVWIDRRRSLPSSIEAASTREETAAPVRKLLALADAYYDSADRGLFALPGRCALSVRAARLIYAAIGDVIRRRRYDVLSGRATVSRARKLWFVLIATVQQLLELPRRMRRPFRPASLSRPTTAREVLVLPLPTEGTVPP